MLVTLTMPQVLQLRHASSEQLWRTVDRPTVPSLQEICSLCTVQQRTADFFRLSAFSKIALCWLRSGCHKCNSCVMRVPNRFGGMLTERQYRRCKRYVHCAQCNREQLIFSD